MIKRLMIKQVVQVRCERKARSAVSEMDGIIMARAFVNFSEAKSHCVKNSNLVCCAACCSVSFLFLLKWFLQ
jgi:hypothetical protein